MVELHELKRALNATISSIERFESSFQKDPKVLQTTRYDQLIDVVKMKIPEEENTIEEVLARLEKYILPHLNLNTKSGYSAYITGSGNFTGAISEFIKGYFNQNSLKWNNSPIATELEKLVVRWVAEFLDLAMFSHGLLTSGGSMSNFLALHLALAEKYPDREELGLRDMPKFTVYASDQTHSSILRGLIFLGLGKNSLRIIPTHSNHSININILLSVVKKDIEKGRVPLVLIGNAGTTNTGAIDDLQSLSHFSVDHNIWYHVDGAYGLPAKGLDDFMDKFKGVEKADSVVINPHKWLYVPFEASVLLLNRVPIAINYTPDYLSTTDPLQTESSRHTIELSKEFRALKVWFTLQYFGKKKLLKFISQDIAHTQQLLKLLDSLENVYVFPVHPLSIGCFRIDTGQPKQDDESNKKLIQSLQDDGRVFMTGTKLEDRIFVRFYFGNPERTVNNIKETYEIIKNQISKILG